MSNYHKTILIVEDEEADRMLVSRAFRAAGVDCPIHVANNSDQAIQYLMGEGIYADRDKYCFPTFIITDLHMPGGDGLLLLEHLQTNPDWGIIPTVVMSSSDDPDDIKKAYMLGASSYHMKPNDLDELRLFVRNLHRYWMTCLVPEADSSGRRVITESRGRLGERYPQSAKTKQVRKKSPSP